jgi:hypothetical protein
MTNQSTATPAPAFDLADYDTTQGAEQGYTLTIADLKTGAPTSMKITVLGADCDAYRERQRLFQRARVDRMNKARRMTVTPEEIEAEAIELLVEVTTGWSGFKLNGADLPFTRDNVRLVYKRYGWIREQVDQAVGDRANFLPKSASGS